MNLINKFDLTKNPRADILSGFTVALALVPEAIAFSFVAGVEPLVGLYAAFFVGIITAIFGGRSGMISGATGAMAVVMVSLVAIHGVQYLFAAILLTGIIQIFAGLLKLGKFIHLVPSAVMLGFVNGLAIVIFLSQLGQFKSNNDSSSTHSESSHSALDVVFNGNWMHGSQLFIMLLLTFATMAIIFIFPKIPKVGKIIPAPLLSILILSGLVIGFNINTPTVGDLASISGGFPTFHIPEVPFNFETLYIILPFSLTLAGIGLIESLLTLTLIDEVTDTQGDSNKECVGQGLSNLTCGFFSAMGGCAMIGQSMINIGSGGRGRLSGIIAALALLSFILFISGWIEMIPIAALTGIMMMVVIGTFAWTSFKILGKIPKEDAFIIILVTGVTVVQDLAIAVIVGVIVSALVYSWKSSRVIRISIEDESTENEKIYKLHGSVFFGSVNNLKALIKPSNDKEKIITLDCSDAWLWDQSAIEAIKVLTEKYSKSGKILKIKNLGPYSLRVVTKANKVFNINLID
tara:strand:+ start:9139 stop:10695 length:1557 start_codon:yes stop_codon:yes gene_type:complete